jgi:enterochelin esterase-like enzyme
MRAPSMVKLRIAATLLLVGSALVPCDSREQKAQCSVVGQLLIRPIKSKIFNNSRMLRIWLPPGYDAVEQRNRRYPVLYLNDGQNLFDACTSIFNSQEWRVDETATELVQSGKIRPIIIVGIDNAGKRERPKEYLPFPDDTLTPATPEVHGRDYPRFLLDEVMPLINKEFRTDISAESTGLGGSSYGAGIALYTVMNYPDKFGRLLLESPSLYAHDDYLLHEAGRVPQWPERVYVGVGSIGEPVDDVHRLAEILRHDGLGRGRVLVVEEPGAAHDENAWAKRFPLALQFLYGERRQLKPTH